MSIPALPVPALEETLRRLLSAATPLQDEPALRLTREQIEGFARGEGPELQAALEDFARAEDAEGRSWLSRVWLRGYLSTREPLPLSTSVGFQIAADLAAVGGADGDGPPGADRAARLIHRAAAVHLQELRGQTPQEMDARGRRLSMEQWRALRGGIRRPRPGVDEILRPAVEAAAAEIGILHRGRLHALGIADEHGRPLPPSAVAAAVRRILSSPSAWSDPALPFGAASALGGDTAARLLAELTEDPHNREVYERLTRMIFLVHLSEDVVEQSEHLRRLAFEPGRTWHGKPLTYEVGLKDPWAGVHVEHSAIDGATLLSVLTRMQQLEIPDGPAAPDTDADTGTAVPEIDPVPPASEARPAPVLMPMPEAVQWRLTPALRRRLGETLAQQREAAAAYETRIVVVDRPDPAETPFRVSDDAAQQLILTCAQLAAFGRVRSAYEAVDVREYRAGRTECLRPVTPAAVECAEALLVSAARTAIGEDFLSTTSIGDAGRIVRYAFAPSTPEGFGVTYTRHAHSYEFCLSSRRDTREDQEAFAQGLQAGARALGAALRSFGGSPSSAVRVG